MSDELDLARSGVPAADNDTYAAITAGVTLAKPSVLDTEEVYSRILPAGATGQILDLEKYLPAPRRTHGMVALQAVDDLVRYVMRHDDPASTTLWVDETAHVVCAVLNDHTQERAQWGDHRARLALRLTPEWKHWTSKDGELLNQIAFAEHIEDGLMEIVDPPGAEMLEVAQSIQGSRNADFSQAHRLSDGNIGATYMETTSAKAGQRGEIEIPERFTLAIAPFLGEEPVELRARLRWRLRDAHLELGYKLERPDRVIRDVIDAIADRLSKQFDESRVFVGTPRD